MASVELKLGDLFDGPSDLIVLPCSTGGTFTDFVQRRLIHYKIPSPDLDMELGDVVIAPFKGGENIAQYVGFAASVWSNSSSERAIRRIGEQLGSATIDQPTIRLVSAPLFGAGAGGLRSELVVEALTSGFKSTAHRDARLIIHVLHNSLFERLSSTSTCIEQTKHEQARQKKPQRVFISYSHTSPEHSAWVKSLGEFLRSNGIEARLDIWHLRPGMDLPQFMVNELVLAERVILISDEKYAEKADGRVGGVGWETMLIQGDMANPRPENNKYLVIVRSKIINDGLPLYLRTKFVIHWLGAISDEKKRDILLRELYNAVKIPPLGKMPTFQ